MKIIKTGVSKRIVNRLILDLTARKGFDNVWDGISQDIKEEIKYKR